MNINQSTALAGERRGGRLWPQEEGLPLFLILDKFSSPSHWSERMFGNATTNVTELIKNEMR